MKNNIKLKGAKILFLCSTDNMIWQFLIPHVKDLIEIGADVDCVCSKTGFWFDELKDKFGFNMIELKMKRKPLNLTNCRAYNSLKKLQKQNNYSLIFCQQPTGGMLGRLLGKKFHLPVIYTAHGFFFFKGNSGLKNFIFRSAEKYMSKYTDILITMNDEDYDATKNWKMGKSYKIHGIGLDLSKYEETPFNLDALKSELGIKNGEKIILSVSEFIKRKNYPTMLKTIAALTKTRSDFKYIICGTGAKLDEMKVLAKKLNIADKVLFLGYRKDIDRITQIADIFYHQSFHEGLTMSIMEAMHFSLPIVASNVRGNYDLVDETGGFLTAPKDIKAQILALNTLLDDEKLRKNMGKNNHEKVKDYYLDNVRNEMIKIYSDNNLI